MSQPSGNKSQQIVHARTLAITGRAVLQHRFTFFAQRFRRRAPLVMINKHLCEWIKAVRLLDLDSALHRHIKVLTRRIVPVGQHRRPLICTNLISHTCRNRVS